MITQWSEGIADDHMDEGILVETESIVRRHPWWQARTALTLALLDNLNVSPPARVLDAGCGWGVTLEALENHGYDATGLDVSPQMLNHLDRPGRNLIQASLTDPLPHETETFDAVLALDVIEHIDDDRAAVAMLGKLAKPESGIVIVSVPARPELFSEFDAVQGHRRRYLPERLRQTFEDTQLSVESIFWWGSWMVPLLKRRVGRKTTLKGATPAEIYREYLRLPMWPAPLALKLAFWLEHSKTLAGKLKTGTSLFAVARSKSPGNA